MHTERSCPSRVLDSEPSCCEEIELTTAPLCDHLHIWPSRMSQSWIYRTQTLRGSKSPRLTANLLVLVVYVNVLGNLNACRTIQMSSTLLGNVVALSINTSHWLEDELFCEGVLLSLDLMGTLGQHLCLAIESSVAHQWVGLFYGNNGVFRSINTVRYADLWDSDVPWVSRRLSQWSPCTEAASCATVQVHSPPNLTSHCLSSLKLFGQ